VPALVVEIKPPDDTFDEIVDKCFEYKALGVPHILVMDPDHKRAWSFDRGDLRLLAGDTVELTSLRIDFRFAEMFAEPR